MNRIDTDVKVYYFAQAMFLACALEAKADYIVSGDKHLREIKHFHGVRIVDVKTFVEKVKKE